MSELFSDVSLLYYKSDSVVRRGITNPRKTFQYEFEFYKTSSGISYVDRFAYSHNAGNVLLIKPNQLRRSKNYFECFAVHFSCADKAFAAKYIDSLPNCVYLPACEESFKRLIMSRRINSLSQNLHINALLMEIISNVHEFCAPLSGESALESIGIENMQRIGSAAEYIKEHYSEQIDSSELHRRSFMSRSTFFRLFKEIIGSTPGDYINTVRIENAKIMLNTTELPAAEIAQMCGFCSQAYFNCIFKKKTGFTPIEYRKKSNFNFI